MSTTAQRSFKFVVMLALIAGLAPIAIHVILPVLPVIEQAFGASNAVTQLTLTLGVVAMGISTIGYGPAADRFGRKPVLLFGLLLFVGGSALCVWSPNITVLIVGRVIQAVGGVAGMVVSRAMIRDMFSREESARVIGQVMSIVILAPIVAPVIGGFIVEFAGWRFVFVLAVVMGAVSLVVAVPGIRETHNPDTGSNLWSQMLRAFPELLRTPAFLGYAGYAGCGMGIFMVVAGGIPFVMVEVFGASPSTFGLYFLLMTGSFLAGTVVSSRLTERIGLDRMIRWGSSGAAIFSISIPALLIAGFVTPWAIFLPGAFMGFSHGLAMPNAQAGAVSVNPAIAGSASGLVIFLQMMIGASFGQAAGMLPHDSALPVATLIASAGIGGFVLYNLAMLFSRKTST